MKQTIRPALPADMPAVLAMIRELAVFEKAGDQVRLDETQMIRDAERNPPVFHCWLVFADEELAGYCLCWYRYSTWRGRMLYVEDLYVKEKFRRKGLGKKLLDEAILFAHSQDISWVSLQVLDWNQPAIEFYQKQYSAILDAEWLNVFIPLNPE